MSAICSEKCWTPKPCPEHGDTMRPFGRDAPIGSYECCDRYGRSDINPRHLWSEHDSTRYYTDPDGWAAHEASCDECNPTETEEPA